jgi:hypothetical protein
VILLIDYQLSCYWVSILFELCCFSLLLCTLIHHNGIQCLGFLLPLKFLDRFDPRIVTLNPNLLEIAVPNRVHHINSTLSQSRTAGHKDNSSQGGYGQHRAFREEATDAYDDWTTHLGPNSHGTGLHSPAQKKGCNLELRPS